MNPIAPRRRRLVVAGLLTPLQAARGQAQALPATAGRVWRVGPGEAISRIADAIRQAGDGDTIEILPGVYAGDVAVIRQRQLTLRGLPGGAMGRPRLQAAGQHAEGKAIWVVRDGDILIEGLDFEGARVPDGNGAAIRFERGRLTLRHCGLQDHEIGLLTGNHADAELSIEGCDFSRAPANAKDLSHLLYVGRIGRFSLRGCKLGAGLDGHLVKSRARQSLIEGNLLDDGRGGQASYEIDLPEGGDARVAGNTVVQSPGSRNAVMLSYGEEGGRWPLNRLVLRDNTFINRLASGGWFVRVWADRLPASPEVLSQGNRYLGPGSLLLGPDGRSVDDQRGPVPAGDTG